MDGSHFYAASRRARIRRRSFPSQWRNRRSPTWRRCITCCATDRGRPIRLLMLTGCRSKEIATLRWDDVNRSAGELPLRDTKTGSRMVPLTPTALAVLNGIDRVSGNPWVFVGQKPASHVSSLANHWHRLRVRADLEDVRLHDLRHSHASRALALGEGLSMIGKLLGHRKVKTTARYAHLARDTERVSAARVAGSIEANILGDALFLEHQEWRRVDLPIGSWIHSSREQSW